MSTDDTGPALSILGDLLPPSVVLVETDALSDDELHEEERRILDTTRPKRRAEFYAGRGCARQALARLGIHDFPLLRDEHRAPIWPSGVTGSITHTENYTAVAVARRSEVASVGIDVERIGRLDETRWPFVFSVAELQAVNGAATDSRAGIVAALFSAKEAYYKCRYQVVRDPLGFHEVEIVLSGSFFEVRPAEAGANAGRVHVPARGRFDLHGGWVFATAIAASG
jgi:enterobactin synthetase component D / holo-[acyl-carrier protein] synthase